MNGILVVNKEKDYTSRDVVNVVSKSLMTKKVGHTGTLDPLATGVLVLAVGSGLKLVELLMEHDKEYVAKVRLGLETDTLDITGTVLKETLVKDITKEKVEAVLKTFVGNIEQTVPKYSAVKFNGKKLYEYARNGEEVKLPVRKVDIYSLELISDIIDNSFYIKCHVSKGTYIRSLIADIGESLGTGAVMEELKRTRVGNFSLEEAYSLEQIKAGDYKLLEPLKVLELPRVTVDVALERKIRNGQVLKKFFEADRAMIINSEGKLIAIYQTYEDGYVKPYRMFL